MNELMTEALRKLDCYIKTGLRGFAQQAWDRLRALDVPGNRLGRVEDWNQGHAVGLHKSLTQAPMLTINQPAYGPQGQPYCLSILTEQGTEQRWFWTEEEAWEARDTAYLDGAIHVGMKGIPFRGAAFGI